MVHWSQVTVGNLVACRASNPALLSCGPLSGVALLLDPLVFGSGLDESRAQVNCSDFRPGGCMRELAVCG